YQSRLLRPRRRQSGNTGVRCRTYVLHWPSQPPRRMFRDLSTPCSYTRFPRRQEYIVGVIGDYRRLMRAGVALARHDVILPAAYQSRLPLPARVAGGVLRLFGGGAKGRPGQRLARALEGLGPAYIKRGQFLATRPDVFGSEVTMDLDR